jgi:hypothetical protein
MNTEPIHTGPAVTDEIAVEIWRELHRRETRTGRDELPLSDKEQTLYDVLTARFTLACAIVDITESRTESGADLALDFETWWNRAGKWNQGMKDIEGQLISIKEARAVWDSIRKTLVEE